MTNAPEARKTHVVRIFGTNSSGELLDSIWIDVERIDEYTIRTQTTHPPNQWQEITIKLKWKDDPTAEDYEPEDDETTSTSRDHQILKICDPKEGNFANPEEWVPVKVIKHVDFNDSGKSRQKRFQQAAETGGRKVESRRICAYNTTIDDAAQAAFDSGRKAYVADGPAYDRLGVKDEEQYVEHDVVLHLGREDSDYFRASGHDQEVELRLKNQYLIDESDAARLEETGPDGVNPPYRLDPFQNIVNVKWSGGEEPTSGPEEFWAQMAHLQSYARVPVVEPSTPHFAWKAYGDFAFVTAMYSGSPGIYANYDDYLYCCAHMSAPVNPLYGAGQAYQLDQANWIAAGEPGGFPPLGYITFTVSGAPYGDGSTA